MYVQSNTEALSHDHFYQGKTVSIKFYDRVSASLPSLSSKQILSFLHPIKLSFVAFLEIQYLPTLSDKQHDSRKKIEHRICVLIFCTDFT